MRIFRQILVGVVLLAGISIQCAEVSFEDGTSQCQEAVRHFVGQFKGEGPEDSLQTYLIDNGFLKAVVTKKAGDSASYSIKFGPHFKINDIIVITSDTTDTLHVNKYIDKSTFTGVLDSIIQINKDRGYNFTEILIDSTILKDSLLDVGLKINRGPATVVTDIEFPGLRKTDAKHLEKYLYIQRGDTLKPDRLERTVNSLRQLDYLEPSGAPEIVPEPGFLGSRLVLPVREKKQFYFNGVAGYIPDDGGTFVGYLDFVARNFMGHGRRGEIVVDRRDRNNSAFKVSFRQPVFISGPGFVNGALETRDYRDYFYEFSLNGSYYQSLSQSLDLNVALGWKNVEPADQSARSFRAYSASLGIKWGQIRAEREPSFQTEFAWTISYSRRAYRAPGEDSLAVGRVYNDTRAEVRSAVQAKLISDFSGYLSLVFKDIESSEDFLPLSELYLIGGPGTLRGYRTDQFAAERAVGLVHEWRLFFSESDYFYPFADGVYFERVEAWLSGEPIRRSFDRWGFGFGVSLSSSAGRLGLSFAWGEDTALDQPRLNVQLSSQF